MKRTAGRSCRCRPSVVASACAPVSPLGSAPKLDVRLLRDRVFCEGVLLAELNRRGTAGISSLCRVDIVVRYGCYLLHAECNARIYEGWSVCLGCEMGDG